MFRYERWWINVNLSGNIITRRCVHDPVWLSCYTQETKRNEQYNHLNVQIYLISSGVCVCLPLKMRTMTCCYMAVVLCLNLDVEGYDEFFVWICVSFWMWLCIREADTRVSWELFDKEWNFFPFHFCFFSHYFFFC